MSLRIDSALQQQKYLLNFNLSFFHNAKLSSLQFMINNSNISMKWSYEPQQEADDLSGQTWKLCGLSD